MTTLIPTPSACVSSLAPGEQRPAELLEQTSDHTLLNAAHQEGHAWADMAVLCHRHHEMDECAQDLSRWQLPFEVRARSGSFHPGEDTIKVMTIHASKGLECPVVALMDTF